VAGVLKDRKIAPGKVLLGGFDLVPQVLDMMKSGYIQIEIDQQPYEQGFMPVMEAYLKKNIGLAPADIDTGEAVITPDQADSIMELSKQGKR
jgi:simple sugar transport system substrate-binding protein